MFDLNGVDFNDVANGLLVFVVGLLAWLGKRKASSDASVPVVQGRGAAPVVEMAALVDSGSLNRHTAAIEALNLTMIAGQKQNKEIADSLVSAFEDLAKDVRGNAYAIDKAKEHMDKLEDMGKDLILELVRKGSK